MNSTEDSPGAAVAKGLLVDTNLLVLFVVGTVNRERIETFKRTRQYTKPDYDLLLRVLGRFNRLYTVAHVMAEVSNLTDLPGVERHRARLVLKKTISLLDEKEVTSTRASEDRLFQPLGLVDAAIGVVARLHDCAVLTDDLDLYLALCRDRVNAINFSHLRERSWGM